VEIDPTAWVASTAVIRGDVTIGPGRMLEARVCG
jgi:carbonic anhydrase/acetyltransferase-like protein (isoleucine patch superfamily)